ncbi:hypothetical protein H9N25_18660 [Pedobacter riviphilus]|uniref:Natural product n=1 Tax=Pedobacter riviphilus TaxID=2766984 RepID=A0ABX6TF33_9SPHI|nr:hypothetical protein [Pedobacter riviphilus]QNR83927.1 hypothetical protein H9N25_18660 [Pedobacter riviphilus]
MKKLTLKPNAFNKGEVLTREQLKRVMGGGTCQVFLPNTPSGGTNWGGTSWGGPNGTPYSGSIVHGTNGTVISGVSSADAQRAVSNGGHWCCDSCGSAPWALPTPV